MTRLRLPSGCDIEGPSERLLRFCHEEYDYYDGIPSSDPDHVEPIDVLATVAVNAFFSANATTVRNVHRGMASRCDPILHLIPADADLLSFDLSLEQVRHLLHAVIQAPKVLIDPSRDEGAASEAAFSDPDAG